MKVGVIQGRLTTPDNGFQDCPKNWKDEFFKLNMLGLNHVEWIVTKDSYEFNPIFFEDVSKYPIHSICADNIVDDRVGSESFVYDSLVQICAAALQNEISNITIPLLEDSDVSDDQTRAQFCKAIEALACQYENLNFSIEAELDPSKLEEIIRMRDNFYVTYDTGNITSCGFDHVEYINRFHTKINNVHLKDRTYKAQTVPPGTGNTDFSLIFKTLLSVGYNGVFTMQTAREEYGQEYSTILNHKNFFQEMFNECA